MKHLKSWAMYDFGSTLYSTLVITIFFPILIREILGGSLIQLGLVVSISIAASALIVPTVGALSDKTHRRIPYIALGTIIATLFIIPTAWAPLIMALIFTTTANVGARVALDIYDAMLGDLAPTRKRGYWSGIGVASSFLGALMAILIAFSITSLIEFRDQQVKMGIVVAALCLIGFTIPIVNEIKEKSKKWYSNLLIKEAWHTAIKTWKTLPESGMLNRFLLATGLFNGAIFSILVFFYLFATEEIGLSQNEFFIIYASGTVLAIIGALVAGRVTDRIGSAKTLTFSLAIWAILSLVIGIYPSVELIIVSTPLAGIAWGLLATSPRPYLIKLSPPLKRAELFGFQGLAEKAGSIAGPLVIALVISSFGYSMGVIMLSLQFIAALTLLSVKN